MVKRIQIKKAKRNKKKNQTTRKYVIEDIIDRDMISTLNRDFPLDKIYSVIVNYAFSPSPTTSGVVLIPFSFPPPEPL